MRDTEYGATPEEEGAYDRDTHRRADTVDGVKTRLRKEINQLLMDEAIVRDSFQSAAQLTSVDTEMYELGLMLCVTRLAEQLQRFRSGDVDKLIRQPRRLVVTNEQMDRMIEIVSGGANDD